MIVQTNQTQKILEKLSDFDTYSLDTETTGLNPYRDDKMFSCIIACDKASYYFNFQTYEGLSDSWVVDLQDFINTFQPLFKNPSKTWYMANAKFDLSMLFREGISIAGTIKDTEQLGRLVYNQHMQYGLDASCAREGLTKSKAVEEYIKANKLYSWLPALGKEKKKKQPHYDKVPFSIIAPYGETDGDITLKLGRILDEKLDAARASVPAGRLDTLRENESLLIKATFEMEKIGIHIDTDYCKRAYDYEIKRSKEAAQRFEELSGNPFKDSAKVLAPAFKNAGETVPLTEKGNPSFTDKVISKYTTPLASCLKDYRKASKAASTYYSNFLFYADKNDDLHANIKLAGTDTGRFSMSEPNLQNLSKEEDKSLDYTVRGCFRPRDGFFFCMIDYDQQEYRMMLDYAGELSVIDKILNDGLDVHTATAEMAGTSRTDAKTLNFLLLYGGGVGLLAESLKLSVYQAKELMEKYYKQLPKVKEFTQKVKAKAKGGYIFNWAGRRYSFPKYGKKETHYKSPNHLIQGGCGDVMRFALVALVKFLEPYKSRVLVTIHDEVLFEIANDEHHLVPDLRKIMEDIYPHKRLKLTCGIDFSRKSWADKEPWENFVP